MHYLSFHEGAHPMTRSLIHYLLIFDHAKGVLLEQRPFEDGSAAVEAYSAAEEQHRDDKLIEIVLVASDSLETIRLTHANYFAEFSPVSRFLSDLAH